MNQRFCGSIALVCLHVLFLCVASLAAAGQKPGQQQGNVGVVAVLTDIAGAGTNVLHVNDTREVDRKTRLLLKSTDGSRFELQYVARMEGKYIYLQAPLKNSYSPQDLLIQGCECDRAIGLPSDGVVGTLKEEVPAKSSVLKYTPTVPLDPKAKLLIRRRDGSEEEVHAVSSYDGGETIKLAGKLKYPFQPGDMLIQGCHLPIAAGGGFPWKKLLLGAGAAAATTVVVTVISGCDDCCPE